MAAAWPFFDRKVDDPWFDPAALQPPGAAAGPGPRLVRVAAAAATLAAAPLLWSAAVASSGTVEAPDFALPEVPGWRRVAVAGRPWQPTYAGADRLRIGRYRDSAGHEVDLALAVFARQGEGRELVGFGQGAVPADGSWAWTADAAPPPSGRAERIFSHGDLREVWSFYRVGGILTGSPAAVKVETVKVHLVGGPQRAVALVASSAEPGARPVLAAFLRALGPVEGLADRAAGLPGAR